MTRAEKLDMLIEALAPGTESPKQESGKWRAFRSLMNLREPGPASPDFIKPQDNFLQAEIEAKGITDVDDLGPIKDNLYLWQGDITSLKADAVVNAANSGLLGCFVPCHGCIDNAIHTYAGIQLRLACYELMQKQGRPEPTGAAKITPAFNLPAKYVIHTVGPIVTGRLTEENCAQLSSCYRSCMELGERSGITSIAFCCISTGEFHFPNKKAAEIAVKAVSDYLAEHSSQIKVIFNVFKESDYEIYQHLLGTAI